MLIHKLNNLLTKRDKQFLIGLLIFSIFISMMETIGISVVMPFIAVASNFALVKTNHYYKIIYQFLHFKSEINFVLAFGVVLIFFYIFRSGINLFYFYLLARFSQGRYHLLAYRLFENYLGLSYRDFIERNSSEINKAIINEAANLTGLLSALLFMMSEVFVIIFIYSLMIYVNWKITFLLTMFLCLNAFFLIKVISPRIKKAGHERVYHQQRFYEIISKSLGNFKLMKLKSNSSEILDKFAKASFGFAKSNIKNQTFTQFPRLFLEAIGFSLVIFIVVYLIYKYQRDISAALPLISMFVLGLYRLMPSVNRILSSYNQILFLKAALDIVHNDLMYKNEELGEENIEFNNKIEMKNVSFEYIKDKPVLQNVNLTIKKGESIAIIGESGSGKSTLLDILIGLYKPLKGKIMVDENEISETNVKSWRKKIGYIPQTIYLFDGTVAENVVFGDETDKERVVEVLKQANIYNFLENFHDGINTKVGENGIKLSGGQKQRIAIARALYNDPEVLVLDEATSSLDNNTEEKIMEEIYQISAEKTLIIVAHRLSTIERCEKVYKLEQGRIV